MLYIHWNPNPDFINFGAFAIKWYGVMWGLGLLWVYAVEQFVWKRVRWDDEKVALAIQYVFISGLIGARLAHILFYDLDYYIAHPGDVLAVWKGGLASHGGLAGGILGLYWFCKNNTEFKFFILLNYCAIAVPLLSSLIRIGNLVNSELVGIPTEVPWAFVFEQVDAIPRHPVVLYESLAYFILQIVMLGVFMKYRDRQVGIYAGLLFVGLFGVRFIIEFLKVPDGELFLGLISKTQALNLPYVIIGIWLIVKTLQANKQSEI